ncbi:MAG: DUF4912 domain-containing protein [Myxococcota bacterium]
MGPDELRKLTREALIERALQAGVPRPRTLTHAELVDEILKRTQPKAVRRGWLGRARDLVASVVERGLHLPEAAKILRTSNPRSPAPPPPLPTITLAEIYAAQGYFKKAVVVLDEVLARQPNSEEARQLRGRFYAELTEAEREDFAEAVELTPPPPAEPAPTDRTAVPAPEPPGAASEVGGGAPSAPVGASYNIDDVVALAVDATTAFAYWEVRPLTFARARHEAQEGRLALKVQAGDAAPVFVSVDELVGDRYIHGLPSGCVLSVSVGWREDAAGRFESLAKAPIVSMPGLQPGVTEAGQAAPFNGGGGLERAPGADSPLTAELEQRFAQGDLPVTWVDYATGVERDRPPWEERVTVSVTRRGGASDLVTEERWSARRTEPGYGGASDLAYGGASDLMTSPLDRSLALPPR